MNRKRETIQTGNVRKFGLDLPIRKCQIESKKTGGKDR